jgi:hypothetical protein
MLDLVLSYGHCGARVCVQMPKAFVGCTSSIIRRRQNLQTSCITTLGVITLRIEKILKLRCWVVVRSGKLAGPDERWQQGKGEVQGYHGSGLTGTSGLDYTTKH